MFVFHFSSLTHTLSSCCFISDEINKNTYVQGMKCDIMDLCIMLEKLHCLKVLLIHNNPDISGDIRYLR
jgi:hypothetical protein